jgi:hypothetical protein
LVASRPKPLHENKQEDPAVAVWIKAIQYTNSEGTLLTAAESTSHHHTFYSWAYLAVGFCAFFYHHTDHSPLRVSLQTTLSSRDTQTKKNLSYKRVPRQQVSYRCIPASIATAQFSSIFSPLGTHTHTCGARWSPGHAFESIRRYMKRRPRGTVSYKGKKSLRRDLSFSLPPELQIASFVKLYKSGVQRLWRFKRLNASCSLPCTI